MLEFLFASLAVTTGVARAWPQFRLIVVHRYTEGVSVTSWVLALVTSIAWEGIGLAEGIPVTIGFNLFTALGAAAVLVGLVRHRQFTWIGFTVALVGSIAGTWLLYVLFGGVGVAILGNALAVVMFMPQLVQVLRHSAEGVSLGTWVLSVVTQTSWALYGIVIHEPVFIWANVVMVPSALVICWRIVQYRRRGVASFTVAAAG